MYNNQHAHIHSTQMRLWISTKDSDSNGEFVLCLNSVPLSVSSCIPQCSVLHCTLSIEIFKSAPLGKQILLVSDHLSRLFLTWFPHTRCHIKGQGFGNKMYISKLFTIVGYFHMAGFKNNQETYCAKCILETTCHTYVHTGTGVPHCLGIW